MADVSTFDAADAAFRDTHEKLRGTLTSQDVAALIATASTHIAECDKLAAERIAAAADPDLPTRNALAAKQEADSLVFVADRLRNLVPVLDRRRAAEADTEEQAWKRDQYNQAQKRVDEIAAKVAKEYPKAVATIMALVGEIAKADAIAKAANAELPRDVERVPNVERIVGSEILSRLHLPGLEGQMAHEMTKAAADAFSNALWEREQRALYAPVHDREEREREKLQAERRAAAAAHNGPQEEKSNILMGFPARMVGPGRTERVA